MKEEIWVIPKTKTYLHITHRHFELSSVILLYRLKNLLDAQGDQSRLIFARVTSHGEGFAGWGLTIGENCLVDAIQSVVH